MAENRRSIDRRFWKCRELNELGVDTRLFAIYLLTGGCDDFGRCRDDTYRLRHGAFPDGAENGLPLADDDIAEMIDDLVAAGFVRRYIGCDDRPLLWLPEFCEWQPIKSRAPSCLDRHPDDTAHRKEGEK